MSYKHPLYSRLIYPCQIPATIHVQLLCQFHPILIFTLSVSIYVICFLNNIQQLDTYADICIILYPSIVSALIVHQLSSYTYNFIFIHNARMLISVIISSYEKSTTHSYSSLTLIGSMGLVLSPQLASNRLLHSCLWQYCFPISMLIQNNYQRYH